MLLVYVLCIGNLFFFFEQKTAYEMRISDWSSDVCSSDLSALSRSPAPAPASGRACSAARATDLADSDESIEKIVAVSQHIRKNSVDLKIFLVFFSLEIGRASCRERVCQ